MCFLKFILRYLIDTGNKQASFIILMSQVVTRISPDSLYDQYHIHMSTR